MKKVDQQIERFGICWLVICLGGSIYTAYKLFSPNQSGLISLLAHWSCTFLVGTFLGACLAIAGFPVIQLSIQTYFKLITKGHHGRTKSDDTSNTR